MGKEIGQNGAKNAKKNQKFSRRHVAEPVEAGRAWRSQTKCSPPVNTYLCISKFQNVGLHAPIVKSFDGLLIDFLVLSKWLEDFLLDLLWTHSDV